MGRFRKESGDGSHYGETDGRDYPGGRHSERGRRGGRGAGFSSRTNDWRGGGHSDAYEVASESLKLDPDVRQYFLEIAPLVGPNGTVKDPEELAALCSNALEEAQGKEAALACDASCGRTLEALLSSAELPRLLAFLQGLSKKDFEAAARHHSGSHIIETALKTLEQHGDAEASEQALSAVCKAASGSAVDLLCDRYGSHVLRRILSTLSGRDVQPAQSKHLGQRASSAGRPSAPPFPALLAQFAEGLAAAAGPHVKQLRLDSSAGPGLQAILLALEGEEAPLQRLVGTFLGCNEDTSAAEPGEVLASADADEVVELMKERSGSHLVEVIVKVAPPPLQAEIFERFFQGRLKELALHPSANFVLQAMLAAAHSPEQVVHASEELEDHFPQLLRENRGGVLAALVASCGRLGTHQKEVCRALARALTAQSSSPSRVVADLLSLDQHIAAGNRWSKLPPLSCAILVTMFGYPKGCCQPFVDSMGSLTEAECAALASDPGGSRVVEAFLTGPALDKQKRLFLSRLRGHYGELAKEAPGSHCVEKCFAAADIKLKEVIVGELADAEAALLRTAHGPHILRKASVSLFKSSPVSWRAHVSASEGARQMFADLFSERPAKKAKKQGGNENQAAMTTAYNRKNDVEIERRYLKRETVESGGKVEEEIEAEKTREKGKMGKRSDGGEKAEEEAETGKREKKRKKGKRSEGEESGVVEGQHDRKGTQMAVVLDEMDADDILVPKRKGKKMKRNKGVEEVSLQEEATEKGWVGEEVSAHRKGKKLKRKGGEAVSEEGEETDVRRKENGLNEVSAQKVEKKLKRKSGAEVEPLENGADVFKKKEKKGKKQVAEEGVEEISRKKVRKGSAEGGTRLDAIMDSLGFPGGGLEGGAIKKRKKGKHENVT